MGPAVRLARGGDVRCSERMRRVLPLLFLTVGTLGFRPVAAVEDAVSPLIWSERMAQSEMARRGATLEFGAPKAHWDYTSGFFAFALTRLSEASGKPAFTDFAGRIIGTYINADGAIRTYPTEEHSLDSFAPGRAVLALYRTTHDERYRRAADRLRRDLATQPRTSDGGYWHKQKYASQMWLDGLYMATPFTAEYGLLFNHASDLDEAAHQLILADKHLYDSRSGLYYHGWDESRRQSWANHDTGLSPNFWGRAEGWYLMALVDTLELLPTEHRDHAKIVEILQCAAAGVAKYQDPASGVWYQVLDQGNRAGNYFEASASSMFVYALAKAVNHGWIDRSRYTPVVERGYGGLLRQFVRNDGNDRWSLTQCCSVAGLGYGRDGSFDYYVHEPIVANDLKGVAPFILAGVEVAQLAGKTTETATAASTWPERDAILARIHAPTFPERSFPIVNFGAKPDGSDSTAAIRAAIEACHAAGGGHVIVPAGTFLTGAIHLLSQVDLHLEAGATLKFLTDPSAYLPVVLTRFEGTECYNYSPFIYAFEQENIAVTGAGTLDGAASDDNWWGWTKRGTGRDRGDARLLGEMAAQGSPVEQRQFGAGHFLRPVFVQPYRCKNVLISGVHIRNSPMWELNPVLCRNVTVRDVDISTHGPNNDGCDPDCSEDVLIEGCTFDTGDDCIAIKSGRNEDGRRVNVASANLVVRNCTMRDGHGGVVLGSEVSGGIHDVYVENCTMDSPSLDRVLRLKSNAARGGVIENVFLRNVTVGKVSEAILTVDFLYEEGPRGKFPPVARNIDLRGVHCPSTPRVLYIASFPEAKVDDVRFRDCSFGGVKYPDRVDHAGTITFSNVSIQPAEKTRSLNSRE